MVFHPVNGLIDQTLVCDVLNFIQQVTITCLELCFGRSKVHVKDNSHGCVTTTANDVMAAAAHIFCKGRWCNMPSCVVIVPLKHGVTIELERTEINADFVSRINFLTHPPSLFTYRPLNLDYLPLLPAKRPEYPILWII